MILLLLACSGPAADPPVPTLEERIEAARACTGDEPCAWLGYPDCCACPEFPVRAALLPELSAAAQERRVGCDGIVCETCLIRGALACVEGRCTKQ